MKLYGGVKVAEYSSSLTPQQRKAVLRDFRSGKVVQLLICSDAMARGMDIEDVLFVISYDVPNFIRSYIHRVGRTARAGNKGMYYSTQDSNLTAGYHTHQTIAQWQSSEIKLKE